MRWIASILRGKSLWEVSSREPKILKRTAIINGSRDLLEFWQPVLCRISKIHDRPVSFPPVADQLTGLRIDDHHPLFDTCIPRSYASVFYVLRTFQFPIYFFAVHVQYRAVHHHSSFPAGDLQRFVKGDHAQGIEEFF